MEGCACRNRGHGNVSFQGIKNGDYFMITREADYAIRVLLFLASQEDETNIVSTSDLAKSMDIPYRFLRKINRKLANAGLVNGIRGNGGGLQLREKKENISILQVLNIIDPKSVKLNTCLVDKSNCSRPGICSVHNSLIKLQNILDHELNTIMFNDLVGIAL